MGAKSNSPPQPPSAASVHCMHHNNIQQSGRSVKIMSAKIRQKSPIHENADSNITCDFGDGDISRCRSRLPASHIASHIASSIIVRSHVYNYMTNDLAYDSGTSLPDSKQWRIDFPSRYTVHPSYSRSILVTMLDMCEYNAIHPTSPSIVWIGGNCLAAS